MILINLPTDIILLIWDFFESNNDSINMSKICKRFINIARDYGYLKHLQFNNKNVSQFVKLCDQHQNSLQSIYCNYLNDPALWVTIPWPKITNFENCKSEYTNIITPPCNSSTTNLKINNNSPRDKHVINVDWIQLKNLEELSITGYDVNLENLEKCEHLKHVVLDLKTNNKRIPSPLSRKSELKIYVKRRSVQRFSSLFH